MDELYDLLSKCQKLLNNSDLNKTTALKLEIQVIKLKRLVLLHGNEWNISVIRKYRDEIDKLYYQLCKLSNSKYGPNQDIEIKLCVTKISDMLEVLSV